MSNWSRRRDYTATTHQVATAGPHRDEFEQQPFFYPNGDDSLLPPDADTRAARLAAEQAMIRTTDAATRAGYFNDDHARFNGTKEEIISVTRVEGYSGCAIFLDVRTEPRSPNAAPGSKRHTILSRAAENGQSFITDRWRALAQNGLLIPGNYVGLVKAIQKHRETGRPVGVWLCEGAKTAAALRARLNTPEARDRLLALKNMIAVVCPVFGGAAAIHRINWSFGLPREHALCTPGHNDELIDWREIGVVTWVVDNDAAGWSEGYAAAAGIRKICPGQKVYLAHPPEGAPVSWDDADPLPEGVTEADRLEQLLTPERDTTQALTTERRTGDVDVSIINIVALLESDGVPHVYLDVTTGRMCIDSEFPGITGRRPLPRLIEDADILDILGELQRKKLGCPTFSKWHGVTKSMVYEALQLMASKNPRNKLAEQLLKYAGQWDGVPRIDDFFKTYFHVKNEKMAAIAGRILFLQMAKRSLEPGAKCDIVVVLAGIQGIVKSTTLEACCEPGRFGDHVPELSNAVEAAKYCVGKMLIEISELNAMRRAENEAIKAFISRKVDEIRFSYDKFPRSIPRSYNMVGTTNEIEFLNDSTGSRRYIVCDLVAAREMPDGRSIPEHVAEMRPQLLGEAVTRILKNEPHWIDDKELQAEIQRNNAEYYRESPYESTLEEMLGPYLDERHVAMTPNTLLQMCNHVPGLRGVPKGKVAAWFRKKGWQSDSRRACLLKNAQMTTDNGDTRPLSKSEIQELNRTRRCWAHADAERIAYWLHVELLGGGAPPVLVLRDTLSMFAAEVLLSQHGRKTREEIELMPDAAAED
ncbi:virulence-associated E family protein [Methylocystis sp. WRRC1]|uniref:virulence-associated E family protein n=1 Tax=Methylocystis sp. WRRC1 TaxID=1732014 RepID=UPI001D15258D|nr:virulence-associated E family protein [Methylocystis sp. WRRC1]MCC3243819.1 virulence-associated E family protein [Methylocystis sp. WRRC1]